MDFISPCYLVAIDRSIADPSNTESISLLTLRFTTQVNFPDLFVDFLMLDLLEIPLIRSSFPAFFGSDHFFAFSSQPSAKISFLSDDFHFLP